MGAANRYDTAATEEKGVWALEQREGQLYKTRQSLLPSETALGISNKIGTGN